MTETETESETEYCGVSVPDADGVGVTCGRETNGHGVTLSIDPELVPEGVGLVGPARIPLCDEHHAALAAGSTDGLSLG